MTITRLAALLLCLSLTGVLPAAEPAPAGDLPFADAVEWVEFGDQHPIRLRISIEINGRGVGEKWRSAISSVVGFYDRDGDGFLSAREAERLPTPFDLRRVLWGQFLPSAGLGDKWKTADANSDGKLSYDELCRFYAVHGVGVTLASGQPPNTARLNKSLVERLDADKDGKVSLAELRKAEVVLLALDTNEDEIIDPAELVKGIKYPGATGTNVMSPAVKTEADMQPATESVRMRLPVDRKDVAWATQLHNRLARDGRLTQPLGRFPKELFAGLDKDRDGDLTAAELATWRDVPPDIVVRGVWQKGSPPNLRSGEKAANQRTIETRVAGARFTLHADPGQLPQDAEQARKRLLDQFRASGGKPEAMDGAGTGFPALKAILGPADRDGDGKLAEAELVRWLELHDAIVCGQVLVTVLDFGRGLFEMLDADGDGRLSVPELRGCATRLEAAGCVTGETLRADLLPRYYAISVSIGHPTSPLMVPERPGPAWFKAMDRNGDGVVSRKEFTGPADVFNKLDTDKDGFLNAEEAAKAEKIAPKK